MNFSGRWTLCERNAYERFYLKKGTPVYTIMECIRARTTILSTYINNEWTGKLKITLLRKSLFKQLYSIRFS